MCMRNIILWVRVHVNARRRILRFVYTGKIPANELTRHAHFTSAFGVCMQLEEEDYDERKKQFLFIYIYIYISFCFATKNCSKDTTIKCC